MPIQWSLIDSMLLNESQSALVVVCMPHHLKQRQLVLDKSAQRQVACFSGHVQTTLISFCLYVSGVSGLRKRETQHAACSKPQGRFIGTHESRHLQIWTERAGNNIKIFQVQSRHLEIPQSMSICFDVCQNTAMRLYSEIDQEYYADISGGTPQAPL